MKIIVAVLGVLLGAHAVLAAGPSVAVDPARDMAYPAANQQLIIPSSGEEMNALFFRAAGAGLHPTMVLLHGLPGNERNLDLAQAVRRAGWNVLTFTYRGAWGSPGRFSIEGAIADVGATIAHIRTPAVQARFAIDPRRIVVAGHSMGGLAAAMHAAGDNGLAGLVLIDAWNAGETGDALATGGAAARQAFDAAFDDLGHALVGADQASLAAEIIAHRMEWRIERVAPWLTRQPVLQMDATIGGNAAENRGWADAMRGASVKLTRYEFATDHAFADHRIALAQAIVDWLVTLPPRQ